MKNSTNKAERKQFKTVHDKLNLENNRQSSIVTKYYSSNKYFNKCSIESQPYHWYKFSSTKSFHVEDNVEFTDLISVFEYILTAIHEGIIEDGSFFNGNACYCS